MSQLSGASKLPPCSSPGKTALLVVGFAGVHSLLASRQAKDAFARIFGERARNGLYRFGFVLQSVATTAWAVRTFLRLPDRPLYRVDPPWSWGLRAMQVASLALLGSAVATVRVRRLTGAEPLCALVKGQVPLREPEAQGPALSEDGQCMDARGPFRHIRHPDNLPIITLLWSFPVMSVNLLTVATISSIYAVLGSLHEDARLRNAYGPAFDAYAKTTPMFLPRRRALPSAISPAGCFPDPQRSGLPPTDVGLVKGIERTACAPGRS